MGNRCRDRPSIRRLRALIFMDQDRTKVSVYSDTYWSLLSDTPRVQLSGDTLAHAKDLMPGCDIMLAGGKSDTAT